MDHATWTGTLLFVVLGLLGIERGFELVLNRRHVRWLREQGAVFHGDDGFGLILAVQVGLILMTPAEALAAPWGGTHAATGLLVGLLVLAQVLRYWVIRTLGPRWCIRVATLPGKERVLGGPYRWLRHPNYLAVALETLALPLAFGAWGTAIVLGALQAIALARRIRVEDAALRAALRATPPLAQ